MTQFTFSSNGLPLYHDGMLVVKLRPSMARFVAAAPASIGAPDTPGMSAMTALERRGLIKQVTPLFKQAAPRAPARHGFVAAFGAMATEAGDALANAGTCMVELEEGADVAGLQNSLAADPDIDYVARVPVRYLSARRTDRPANAGRSRTAAAPPAPSTMWNLARIRWQEARQLKDFHDAEGVRVAVLDTGIDTQHPDLEGRIAKYVYQYPGVNAPSDPKDIIGHGTHVAGTIVANFANEFGVNGICTCDLMAWKIFDDQPDFLRPVFSSGEFVYFVNPIMYRMALAGCLDENVQVINLSIGGGGRPDPAEQTLFDELLARGVTIVAAMGNKRESGSPISYPAAIDGVIAVGATNVNDRCARFSNGGPHISLSAPGVGIWSTLPTYPGQFGFDAVVGPDGTPTPGAPHLRENDYNAWDGTSMATPHVAAAAALLLANGGRMSGSDVRDRLMQTADPVPDMMGADFHPDYGAGRLNLLELLRPYA